jgi:hypothetical protein
MFFEMLLILFFEVIYIFIYVFIVRVAYPYLMPLLFVIELTFKVFFILIKFCEIIYNLLCYLLFLLFDMFVINPIDITIGIFFDL